MRVPEILKSVTHVNQCLSNNVAACQQQGGTVLRYRETDKRRADSTHPIDQIRTRQHRPYVGEGCVCGGRRGLFVRRIH